MGTREEDIKKEQLASLLALKEAQERNEVFTEAQAKEKERLDLAFAEYRQLDSKQMKAKLQAEQENAQKVAVQSPNIDALIKNYKDLYSKQSWYKEPETESGNTKMTFPDSKTMTEFMQAQAKNKERFTIVDGKTKTVMGYSNGDGVLRHANGSIVKPGESLKASDMDLKQFQEKRAALQQTPPQPTSPQPTSQQPPSQPLAPMAMSSMADTHVGAVSDLAQLAQAKEPTAVAPKKDYEQCLQQLESLERKHTPQGIQHWEAGHAVAVVADLVKDFQSFVTELRGGEGAKLTRAEREELQQGFTENMGEARMQKACDECMKHFQHCSPDVQEQVRSVLSDMKGLHSEAMQQMNDCIQELNEKDSPTLT